ncbi:Metallo-dependent phosphatase-like protein [Ephemerocybe angulata]|uniref:Metallo-dependent phosphatase-like protein n=1 Tax=Ephemerocybe angulata TaxID=980116 RepID=A0A8H6MDK7_9AGAR|nr:Metallo-dependent phosphatase-like protein [Tulosesus angulatus]
MALFKRGRLVVVTLSILWAIAIVWEEYLQFAYDGGKCDWPDHKFRPRLEGDETRPQHVLIVADPQILDHRSYPGRGAFLTWLSRIIVDLNLRKNWWVATAKKPDAVVFLGDMMDGGRFDMSDEEYEKYYQRFKSIFKLDTNIPQYYIPGNHDTGLGFSQTFSPYTHLRYTTHFGPKNYAVQLANHTLTFIDAPGFVDEEYDNWKPLKDGTLEFMKKFKADQHTDPVILFTHVPLYRPDGRGCGPLRERGTIRPGVGNGYQNTLGKQSTQKLLELLEPSLVFSGDDHDYCEHIHRLSTTGSQPGGAPRDVREITVKALSMAMGIRRPGFQLLSLAPPSLRIPTSESLASTVHSHADIPCLLPDQLRTYLSVYIPLGMFSLIALAVSQFISLRPRTNLKHSVDLGRPEYDDGDDSTGGRGTFRLFPANRRPRRDGVDVEEGAPSPAVSISEKNGGATARYYGGASKYFQKFFAAGRPSSHRRMRPRRRMVGFLLDVRDVAVWPLGLFILITWWFS